MHLKTETYLHQKSVLPQSGKQIVAQFDAESIVVYQAFNAGIAADAVRLQKFGGSHYSFERMSWIKPNFLWMMYRCGWASKENQEHVLAIRMTISGFLEILGEAVHSSFESEIYPNREAWQAAMKNSAVRLQWDPDHDPNGNKVERRAIQLGLKGRQLRRFSDLHILSIDDITDFVREEKRKLQEGGQEALRVPVERVFEIEDEGIAQNVGIRVPA